MKLIFKILIGLVIIIGISTVYYLIFGQKKNAAEEKNKQVASELKNNSAIIKNAASQSVGRNPNIID